MFTAIFNDCALLKPSEYQNHPLIERFGSPNIALNHHALFELVDGKAVENAFVLPLYSNPKHDPKQIAVMGDNQSVLFFDGEKTKYNPTCFALLGESLPNIDDRIFMAFNLEQGFKLANCGYHVACLLSNDSCKHDEAKKIKPIFELRELDSKALDKLVKRIKTAVNDLNKAGYHHVYFPLSLADIQLERIQALSRECRVQLLPLTLSNEHGDIHCFLSQDEENEDIQYLINAGVNQAINHLNKGHLAPTFDYAGGYFRITQEGVHYINYDKYDEPPLFICSPILIKADTRDDTSHNWGRLCEWQDRDYHVHRQAFSNELFQTDGADLRKALSNAGLTINSLTKARNLFNTYLSSYPTDKKAICVERTGWYYAQYVLPHKVIGDDSQELIVYQSNSGTAHAYSAKGELSDWQQYIATPCKQHDKLAFALCTAFAGALLTPLNVSDGQCYHFKGLSSKGKSTALRVASSVWGQADSFIRTWRATSNALENTAYLHNDGFLALDEIGQAGKTGAELGEIVYMLCNGQGKARLSRNIINRPVKQWRLIVLSSGERTLKEMLNDVGQQAKLGQEIRFIDIDVDMGQYGVFDSVNFADTASEQAELLNYHSKQYYGVAGEAWLDYLTMDYENIVQQAKALYDEYKQALQANSQESHIKRVASQFALLAVAGELASRANITTWEKGRAFNAVQSVFKQWLANFEYKGNYQTMQILKQVRAFLELHGSSRFESIDGNHEKVYNCAGYFKMYGDEKHYLIHPTVFENEICKGLNHKHVTQVLADLGWLVMQNGRNKVMHRVYDQAKTVRLYTLTGKAITDDLENLPNMGKSYAHMGENEYALDFQGEQIIPLVTHVMATQDTPLAVNKGEIEI